MTAYHARRSRVLKRLADLHPDEYADLMAAERVREGLDPAGLVQSAKCGTRSAAQAHYRRGEPACPKCRKAEREYQKDYRFWRGVS